MNRSRSTSTVLLPSLALLATLGVTSSADAALVISNGFRSSNATISNGFAFSIDLEGSITHQGNTYDTDVALDCTATPSAEELDCQGTLWLESQSADVVLGYDPAQGRVVWGIDAGGSNPLEQVHEYWGDVILEDMHWDPNEIAILEWHELGGRRVAYYSVSWASIFESITGDDYLSTVWGIWTE